MRKLLNLFDLSKLLVLVMIIFIYSCMWGCGDSDYRQWGGAL